MLGPFFSLLMLCNIVDVIDATAIASPTTTKNSEPSIVRRADNIPTISLGDVGQYIYTGGEYTAQGGSVAIFPTGLITAIPTKGLHVALGPDLQSNMVKVLKEQCGDSAQMDTCQKEISKLLHDGSMNKHAKRFVGPLLISTFTIAEIFTQTIAGIVEMLPIAGAAFASFGSIYLPYEPDAGGGVLNQINSLTDASVIAIATGTSNSVLATVTLTSAPSTPTSGPEEVRIEQLDQDGDNRKRKGDIIIHIPRETGELLLFSIREWGLSKLREVCKAPGIQGAKRKRTLDDDDCVKGIEQMALQILGEAHFGSLQNLVLVNEANPMNPANNPEGALVPDIVHNDMPTVLVVARVEIDRLGFGEVGLDITPANMVMRAAIVTEAVLAAVLDTIEEKGNEFTVWFQRPWMRRIKEEDIKCQAEGELLCVSDDCKGYSDLGGLTDLVQTGACSEKGKEGCRCTILPMPYVHTIEESYFETLEALQEKVLQPDPGLGVNCDSNNKIDVGEDDFYGTLNEACRKHDELKKLKKRGTQDFWWSTVDKNGLQWSFDWYDKRESVCEASCNDIFSLFRDEDKCGWDGGMTKDGSLLTDCGIASFSVDKPNQPECWPATFGAPRGQREVDEQGGSGRSVDEAMEHFCNDIDGKNVQDSNDDSKRMHAWRFGFSELGVRDRWSFWLKAEYVNRPTCQGYETPHKTNCKAAFKHSMEICASPGLPRTPGFRVPGIGCIDYSLHITDNTHDDSPPWKEPVKSFPPPLSAPNKDGRAHDIVCFNGAGYRPVYPEDREKAYDAICQDGHEIKGMGKYWENMVYYPPKGQPPFYSSDLYTMQLTMGASTVNQGDDEPYSDMKWCFNYDWKLGRDDCLYALRSIYNKCGDLKGFSGGSFTYRCVRYLFSGVNGRSR